MKRSKLIALMFSLLIALLVLSGSIAAPLLCRPFYYAHIAPMGLAEYTGLTAEQIRQAYDQVMDFCLGRQLNFSAGVLRWSESGASHFADVRTLFLVDLWVLVLSLALLVALVVFCCRKHVQPYCFWGHGPGFWAATGLGTAFLTVGGLAALDFDRAFVVFHTLLFPGKSNWMFDWQTDPVILILPEEFFRNCALLVLTLLLIWCAVLILADLRVKLRRSKPSIPPLSGGCSGRRN